MRSRSTVKWVSPPARPMSSISPARVRTAAALSSERACNSKASAINRSVFFQRTPDNAVDVLLRRDVGGVIAGGLLRGDLDIGVGGYELGRDRHALDDVDALRGQRVVLHVAHREEAVDALQAEPVDGVGHQLLEARVLDAGDA